MGYREDDGVFVVKEYVNMTTGETSTIRPNDADKIHFPSRQDIITDRPNISIYIPSKQPLNIPTVPPSPSEFSAKLIIEFFQLNIYLQQLVYDQLPF